MKPRLPRLQSSKPYTKSSYPLEQLKDLVQKPGGDTLFSTLPESKRAFKVRQRPVSQGGKRPLLNTLVNGKKVICGTEEFEIIPQEIVIKDIAINQIYEVSISVRNLSQIPRRIKVIQPQTSKFRCDYDVTGVIAAGLQMKLIITFETSILADFHDVLKLVSDNKYFFQIPLHAIQPNYDIQYEKTIKFGFVKVGKEQRKDLIFTNTGSRVGKMELKISRGKDFLKIEPPQLLIDPQSSGIVQLKYYPKETGIFHGTIEVITFSPQEQYNMVQSPAFVDITATSVEFSRHLLDQQRLQVQNIDFGTVYFGQLKILETKIANNTPEQQKYEILVKEGNVNLEDPDDESQQEQHFQTPQEYGISKELKIVWCSPESGTIEPYSELVVK